MRKRSRGSTSSAAADVATAGKKAAKVVEQAAAKAGGNWKALKKTLATESGGLVANGAAAAKSFVKRKTANDDESSSTGGASRHQSEGTKSGAPATQQPWFADSLAPEDLALAMSGPASATARSLEWQGIVDPALRKEMILNGPPETATSAKKDAGQYLAMDCEMVGVGPKGSESHVARVSIVNFHGALLLDKYVRPREKVTDFRTWVSGIKPWHLKDAPSFNEVQAEVADMIRGKILVGHALHNDLDVLMLSHPRAMIRDTANYPGLREKAGTKFPSLKKLAKIMLDIDIQEKKAGHSSVEDARTTMAVYRLVKAEWDQSLRNPKRKHDAVEGEAGEGAGVDGDGVAKSTRKLPVASRVWQAPGGLGVAAAAKRPQTAANASTSAGAASMHTKARGRGKAVAVAAPRSGPSKPKVAAKADWWKEGI